MKRFGLVSAAAVSLIFGYSVPGSALQDRQDEGKPPAQEEPKAAKPAKQQEMKPAQQDAKPSQQDAPKAEQRKERKEDRQEQNSSREQEQQANRDKDESRKSQDQARKNQDEQSKRSEHAPVAGGNRGARIPENKFHDHFGRSHTFVVNRPVIIDNRPRFQYASYWFELVDPWPSDWTYTDECYIDYVDDGYYLFNPLHPGLRIAIFVVM